MTHMVKNPPAMQEIWVQSLVWEDALEEGITTHSSVLAWEMPRTEGAWRAAEVDAAEATWHGMA